MLELPKEEINYYQLYKYNKWTEEEISKFIQFKIITDDFNEFLKIIYEYRIPFNQICSFNKKYMHQTGINNFYKKNKDREIDELLEEHEKLLKDKEMYINSKTEDYLISQRVKEIKELSTYYINTNIRITKESINEPDIIYLKNNDDKLIAYINKSIKNIKNFELNDSQIYALLVLLDKKQNKGKIVQISVEEEKTILINCLAIIMVLKGYKVDIISKDEVLAKRYEEESKDYFGISVGNNLKEKRDENKREFYYFFEEDNCYDKDIIYGTTFEYIRDILKDEYHLTGIRKNRNFDIVIVDEIDSMLIDQYVYKTSLSDNKPFIEKYSIFLQLLWCFYKRLNIDDEEILKDEKLCKLLCDYLKEKIIKIINSNEFPMSNMEKNFALVQINNWIEGLIHSLRLKKNEDYIIKNNLIIPLDKNNTGMMEKSQILSYGLQQFLEIKNNLPVTPISLRTNCLSNLGFFKRYIQKESNNIYGVTGTLGSINERKLLGDIYELDFDYIPPNNEKIIQELTSCLCFDHLEYIKNIIRIINRETDGGRSILIICETNNSLNQIYTELNSYCNNLNLINILEDDNNDKTIPEIIESGIVIISTIISRRGIHLKLGNEVLKNGGLHIIITFIPSNCRVEEQIYESASKNGEPGTWQLVINYKESLEKYLVMPNINELYLNYLNIFRNKNSIGDLN